MSDIEVITRKKLIDDPEVALLGIASFPGTVIEAEMRIQRLESAIAKGEQTVQDLRELVAAAKQE